MPAQPLAGATFGLYANQNASGAPMATCESQANGTCTFDKIPPGNYSVKEISAPVGYSPDPSVRTLTVVAMTTTERWRSAWIPRYGYVR